MKQAYGMISQNGAVYSATYYREGNQEGYISGYNAELFERPDLPVIDLRTFTGSMMQVLFTFPDCYELTRVSQLTPNAQQISLSEWLTLWADAGANVTTAKEVTK